VRREAELSEPSSQPSRATEWQSLEFRVEDTPSICFTWMLSHGAAAFYVATVRNRNGEHSPPRSVFRRRAGAGLRTGALSRYSRGPWTAPQARKARGSSPRCSRPHPCEVVGFAGRHVLGPLGHAELRSPMQPVIARDRALVIGFFEHGILRPRKRTFGVPLGRWFPAGLAPLLREAAACPDHRKKGDTLLAFQFWASRSRPT